MPRKVQGPDGVLHLFPDDATDAEVQAALEASTPRESPSLMTPQPSATDRLVGLLPAAGGTVGGIVGGIGGTVLGMGVGGAPGAIGGATLGGAAGEAVRQLVERFRGNDAPKTSGDAALGIAKEGGIQGAMEAGGAAASKYVIKPAATAVMRGYLKPSLAGVKIDKARQIVQTALDEALPVTKAGEERAGRLITDLNKQINGILDKSGGKVNLSDVADKVRAFAKAKYYKPGVDSADFDAAMSVADSLDSHPSMQNPFDPTSAAEVSASKANDVKQAVRPNSRAYGQQGSAPEAATRKVAGSEMRQAIEGVAPEVGPLNAREGRLIDAQDAVKHAAGREENRNPFFGMPTMLAGAVGAEEGYRRDPAAGIAMALATRAALSPAVATRMAILASRLAKNGYTAAAAARLALAAIQNPNQNATVTQSP